MSDHLGIRPENVVNLALISMGYSRKIGSLREGSKAAEAMLVAGSAAVAGPGRQG